MQRIIAEVYEGSDEKERFARDVEKARKKREVDGRCFTEEARRFQGLFCLFSMSFSRSALERRCGRPAWRRPRGWRRKRRVRREHKSACRFLLFASCSMVLVEKMACALGSSLSLSSLFSLLLSPQLLFFFFPASPSFLFIFS